MAKKPSKKTESKTKEKASAKASKELSEDELEQVAGGAFDAFLKIDGVQGITGNTTGAPTESLTLNFTKVNVTYKPQ
jgi:bacteriocin-like protein